MSLKNHITNEELSNYVAKQLNNLFPSANLVRPEEVFGIQKKALEKIDYCFSKINIKYFFNGKNTIFNHLNGDQYSMYLYIMSNIAFKDYSNDHLASKLYLLNKALHGIDAFYEVKLPEIFVFIHPVGTILGRASYKDYLQVYQRRGIGTNKNNKPDLGKYLTLHPGASILGKSNIGDNCSIASDSILIDMDLKANQLYIGNPKKFYLQNRADVNNVWVF